ncbi:hypothetical protein E2562_038456 [Oryza meyeriana var. granulata]|uniref:Uncharacterized protein n=1 Tax=Oryza meyeriana var. granulata TaxID=110450 RepID=A0A6G1EUA5_9ORYZ|nr:hypothetical protein E2562_038456 [Oryza meyeriana var. granulata]
MWQEDLAMMLRMVVGVNDIAASILPREDLALCSNRGRMVLQETLPKCDIREIQEHAPGMAPGSMQIPRDGDNGVRRDGGATRDPGAGPRTEEAAVVQPEASLPQRGKAALELKEEVLEPKDDMPQHGVAAPVHSLPRGGGLHRRLSAREVVDRLRAVAAAEWAELNEKCFSLAKERECLEEGRQVLETLVRTAKAVYECDVAEIERE